MDNLDSHKSRARHVRAAVELHQQGQFAHAEQAYRSLLASDAMNARLWHLLGILEFQTGRLTEALADLNHSVQLDPKEADAQSNLASVLGKLERHEDALKCLQIAVHLRPTYPEGHHNIGVALEHLGRYQQAAEALRRAIFLRPDYAEAHNHLGNVLRKMGEVERAIESHRTAIRLKPNYPEAFNNLAATLTEQGDQAEMVACYRRAASLQPSSPAAHSDLLYALYHLGSATPQMLYEEAIRWAKRHAGVAELRPFNNPPHLNRRLRVGYLSPDFREHTIPRLIAPILTAHDRNSFEIFCYSAVLRPDQVTARLQSLVDHWRDIHSRSDGEAAQVILQDRIDILVDLCGHMAGNRLPLLARRPAPVQVQLGYAGTTGVPAIDYRITDAQCDPPSLTDRYHTEVLVRLADCAWCYEPDITSPQVNPAPALTAGHVTFISPNRLIKVTDEAISVWSDILKAVPGSRLLMLSGSAGPANTRLRERFAIHDIRDQHLELIGPLPRAKYLELFRQADIALDPFPYNGDTTTCDALWMGVPVISLAGDHFVARRGLSLLSSVGLDDLVADSLKGYWRKAQELAADVPRIQALRSELRERMARSALPDGVRYTRHLENAFRQMWEKWVSGPQKC